MTNREKYAAFLKELKTLLPVNRFVAVSATGLTAEHHVNANSFLALVKLGAIISNGERSKRVRYKGTASLHELKLDDYLSLIEVDPDRQSSKFKKPIPPITFFKPAEAVEVKPEPVAPVAAAPVTVEPPVKVEIRYDAKCLSLTMPRDEWRTVLSHLM